MQLACCALQVAELGLALDVLHVAMMNGVEVRLSARPPAPAPLMLRDHIREGLVELAQPGVQLRARPLLSQEPAAAGPGPSAARRCVARPLARCGAAEEAHGVSRNARKLSDALRPRARSREGTGRHGWAVCAKAHDRR